MVTRPRCGTLVNHVIHCPPCQGEGSLVGPASPGHCCWQSHVLVTGLGLNREQGSGPATPCGDAQLASRIRQMFRHLPLFALST